MNGPASQTVRAAVITRQGAVTMVLYDLAEVTPAIPVHASAESKFWWSPPPQLFSDFLQVPKHAYIHTYKHSFIHAWHLHCAEILGWICTYILRVCTSSLDLPQRAKPQHGALLRNPHLP